MAWQTWSGLLTCRRPSARSVRRCTSGCWPRGVSVSGCAERTVRYVVDDAYSVVIVLHALALPQIALRRVVIGLALGGLLETLDVAVDVARHLVVCLHAARLLERRTRDASLRRGEVTMSVSKGGHCRSGQDGGGELHGYGGSGDWVGW
jgi:uncharacterized membrane protein YgcG